ncbi:hypothetical protein ACFE04_006166 [Oxalis oulophora]
METKPHNLLPPPPPRLPLANNIDYSRLPLANNIDYFKSFPPGYRFRPTDEELINEYLRKKIKNIPMAPHRIMDVVLYSHNPYDLAGNYSSYGDNEWYFFTPRERKYKNGTRPNRAAGDGYWKATGADKNVKSKDTTIGFKKSLVFYKGKPPKGNKTNWIMHEYTLADSRRFNTRKGTSDMQLDEWVLCKIYEKMEKTKARKKENETSSLASPHHDKGIDKIEEHHDNGDDNIEECGDTIEEGDDNIIGEGDFLGGGDVVDGGFFSQETGQFDNGSYFAHSFPINTNNHYNQNYDAFINYEPTYGKIEPKCFLPPLVGAHPQVSVLNQLQYLVEGNVDPVLDLWAQRNADADFLSGDVYLNDPNVTNPNNYPPS